MNPEQLQNTYTKLKKIIGYKLEEIDSSNGLDISLYFRKGRETYVAYFDVEKGKLVVDTCQNP